MCVCVVCVYKMEYYLAINEILPFAAKKKKKLKFQVLARKDAKQLELSSIADGKITMV